MPFPYDAPDVQWFDGLAASQDIADPEVAHCWPLIREGIDSLQIGIENIGEIIAHLRAGNGRAFNELSIEVELDDPERAFVAILDDLRPCPAAALIAELERLRERALLNPMPPPLESRWRRWWRGSGKR